MPAQRVLVIGAGFSGLLTAVHLLAAPGTEVILVERAEAFGRGAAYATGNPDHLLNVRLGNMSAFPDEPEHLRRWLAASGGETGRDGFIARGVYGDYLQALLAEAAGAGGARLRLVRGEAVDLWPEADGWVVDLREGGQARAEAVVLAPGNLEPLTPPGLDARLLTSRRYVADPWRGAADLPPEARRVLLIGTGLTMVDVALSVRAPGRRLTALSRRGLLPRAHAPAASVAAAPPRPGDWSGHPAAVLHRLRRLAREGDWRAAMDEVRLSARDVWRGWTPRQRAAALRHLRPWWDVHRHRLAPSVADAVDGLVAAGELSVAAGSIVALEPDGGEVALIWRPRGGDGIVRQGFDAVVNCTGPLGDLRHSRSPLIGNLLTRGLISPDPHGLGARVDDACRLLAANDAPTAGLYAVGPLTRGVFWEMTSVPDLRGQARDVAGQVVGC